LKRSRGSPLFSRSRPQQPLPFPERPHRPGSPTLVGWLRNFLFWLRLPFPPDTRPLKLLAVLGLDGWFLVGAPDFSGHVRGLLTIPLLCKE